jgi:Family of unknown function (DUF6171)
MSDETLKPLSERRMEICNQCPEYHHYICRQCGCFMPIKVKFTANRCPLGKWGPVDPKTNLGV